MTPSQSKSAVIDFWVGFLPEAERLSAIALINDPNSDRLALNILMGQAFAKEAAYLLTRGKDGVEESLDDAILYLQKAKAAAACRTLEKVA